MQRQPTVSVLGIGLSVLACVLAGVVWLDVGRPAAPRASAEEREHLELGEAMNSLARRFAALWYAHEHGNVKLAEYELHEMEEIAEHVEDARPIENGVDVAGMLNAIRATHFQNLRQALAAGDHEAFARAYASTIQACNTCHAAVGHEFIRIKVPTQPPVSNREWSAPR